MGRRRKNSEYERTLAGVKAVVAILFILAFLGGGVDGFSGRLIGLLILAVLTAICLACFYLIYVVVRRTNWSGQGRASDSLNSPPPTKCAQVETPAPFEWTDATILEKIKEIDWYQFEKFCEALFRAEGYSVDRKGGAQPDGGVDLIVTKFDGKHILVQCKHWNSWKVGEPTVRQMLGSMTDFKVDKGSIIATKGWTKPAAEFAAKHDINMVSGEQLASWARSRLSNEQLAEILNNTTHHCPKCEAPMLLKEGDFKSFWGCSTYPRCRGTIKIAK